MFKVSKTNDLLKLILPILYNNFKITLYINILLYSETSKYWTLSVAEISNAI